VRFAFCKGDAVLDAALERMERWLEARRAAPRAAAG
jgi:hypothetical protein